MFIIYILIHQIQATKHREYGTKYKFIYSNMYVSFWGSLSATTTKMKYFLFTLAASISLECKLQLVTNALAYNDTVPIID
jgi:hypothetical protein